MFSIKNKNIYKSKKEHELYSLINSTDFNISRYILKEYGSYPSTFYVDDKFNDKIYNFLLEKAKLIKFNLTGKLSYVIQDKKEFRGGSFWFFYKDVYIKLSVSGQDEELDIRFSRTEDENDKKYHMNKTKTYEMTIVAPSDVQNYHFEDFKDFVIQHTGSKIHLFIKNQYGDYSFEPIKVNTPEIDLGLNYGKKFLDIDKQIQDRLLNSSTGLFMFHGKPGTGKTTYIKYLASKINKDFIFIPTTMIETFTSDPNCLQYLIQKPNSILILEDAEKAVLKRYGDTLDSSNVSALLNLSDGILSDILKISVILTYNCSKNEIDSALKRKGRLQADYEFDLLDVDDAINLAKHLNVSNDLIDTIKEPTSLADIYNLGKDVEFKNDLIKKEEQERIVGFANS
jgi:hypothetical protein